jgi:hypothetical protein
MKRLLASRMSALEAVVLVCTPAVLGACRSAVDDFYHPLTTAPEPTSCAAAGGAGGATSEDSGTGTDRGAAGAEGGEGGCARQ